MSGLLYFAAGVALGIALTILTIIMFLKEK